MLFDNLNGLFILLLNNLLLLHFLLNNFIHFQFLQLKFYQGQITLLHFFPLLFLPLENSDHHLLVMSFNYLENLIEFFIIFHKSLHRTSENLAGGIFDSVQPVFHQDFLFFFFQDDWVQSLLDFGTLQRVFRIPGFSGLGNRVENVQSTLKHYFREDL